MGVRIILALLIVLCQPSLAQRSGGTIMGRPDWSAFTERLRQIQSAKERKLQDAMTLRYSENWVSVRPKNSSVRVLMPGRPAFTRQPNGDSRLESDGLVYVHESWTDAFMVTIARRNKRGVSDIPGWYTEKWDLSWVGESLAKVGSPGPSRNISVQGRKGVEVSTLPRRAIDTASAMIRAVIQDDDTVIILVYATTSERDMATRGRMFLDSLRFEDPARRD